MYEKIIVLKFGGSCLGPLGEMIPNLENVKKEIQKYTSQNYKVVAVFSAPKGMTRELDNLAVNALDKKHPDYKKYADSVLGIGEQVSTHLINSYLNTHNQKSESLINESLPIVTDSESSNANIIDIETSLIYDAFEQNNVVVIPGYIGKDQDGMLTTLGFDGSDTTAIYLTSALKAKECILYKDVEGIYPVRPDKVSTTVNPYKDINFEDMTTYSLLGGRIVNPKGLIKAKEENIPIRIKSIDGVGEGTLISGNAKPKEFIGVTYLNGHVKQKNGKKTIVSYVGEDAMEQRDAFEKITNGKYLSTKEVEEILNKELNPSEEIENKVEISLPKEKTITFQIENEKMPKKMLEKIFIEAQKVKTT